jgi:hypothetical protein
MAFKNEYVPPLEQETSEFLGKAWSMLWALCAWRSLLALSLVGTLAACDKYSHFDFEEELPMHDGRTLLIKHHIQLGAKGRKIEESSSPLWESFTFENPDKPGQVVTFKSPYTDFGPAQTLMLDVFQGVPYTVVAVWRGYKPPKSNPKLKAGCPSDGGKYCYECPDPPYILFRWKEGQWEQLDGFQDFPKHFVKTNAYVDYYEFKGIVDGGYPRIWVTGGRIDRAYVELSQERRLKRRYLYKPPELEILRPYGDEIQLLCPGNINPPLTPEEIANGIRYGA